MACFNSHFFRRERIWPLVKRKLGPSRLLGPRHFFINRPVLAPAEANRSACWPGLGRTSHGDRKVLRVANERSDFLGSRSNRPREGLLPNGGAVGCFQMGTCSRRAGIGPWAKKSGAILGSLPGNFAFFLFFPAEENCLFFFFFFLRDK